MNKVSVSKLVELAQKYEDVASDYEFSGNQNADYADTVKSQKELETMLNQLMLNGWVNDMACSAGFDAYYSKDIIKLQTIYQNGLSIDIGNYQSNEEIDAGLYQVVLIPIKEDK